MADQAAQAAYAAAATELAKSFVASFLKSGERAWSDLVSPHLRDFEDYLSSSYLRYSHVKTILDRSEPIEFDKLYVKARYRYGNNEIGDDEICQKLRDNDRVVVQGFGGIGKTMLMKHLWLSVFRNPAGKIPVFLELRRLNDFESNDLLAFARASLSPSGKPLNEREFEILMKAGRFLFILDAFDEVNDELRNDLERQILSLSFTYVGCGVVVSSRHNNRFESWESFIVAQVLPFGKDQIVSVIEKIPFDKKTKTKFLSEIIHKKYSIYETFLTTPLLATMMLMTFDQFADIPEKVHLFYKYAFQTLYTLHDSGKESFSRKRKSGLDEDEFCKILSIVCISSYILGQYVFDKNTIIKHIEKAIKITESKVKAADILSELCESVNILYQEGDSFSFVHRSFQEYFSAYALTVSFTNHLLKLVDKLPNGPGDAVLMMAYEMNRALFEESYFVPKYAEFSEKIDALLKSGGREYSEFVAVELGLQIVILNLRTPKRQETMSQAGFVSPLADWVARVLSCVPGEHPEKLTDFVLQRHEPTELSRFLNAVCRHFGVATKERPAVFVFNFVLMKAIFNGPGKESRSYDLDPKAVEIIMTNLKMKRQLEEAISRERGRLVTLERLMRRVKGRSKIKTATLEELLEID
jgi:hypothetical protein